MILLQTLRHQALLLRILLDQSSLLGLVLLPEPTLDRSFAQVLGNQVR